MMQGLLCLAALAVLGSADPVVEKPRQKLPEEGMRAREIIEYNGYVAEYHNVTTDDGYILTMVRIPYGKAGPGSGPRKPIFLQHGLGASCMNWITNLPHLSLGYILADKGYDVFMGNMRGNSYSLGHKKLDYKKDKAFWDFSWQTMAAHDLPALVEAAIAINGHYSQVAYVGHSQGTLIGFTHFSSNPFWTATHINHFFALAPVYYLSGITSPLRYLAPFAKDIYKIYQLTGGIGSTNNEFLSKYITPVCRDEWVYKYICQRLQFYILGKELPHNINQTRVPVFFGSGQGGTSIRNYLAFAQGVNSGLCQKFEYESELKNLLHYQCCPRLDPYNCPPRYRVDKIKVPMHIYYSDTDELADLEDAQRLLREIPLYVKFFSHFKLIRGYSHVDFLFGTDVVEQIYDEILDQLSSLRFF